MVTVCPTIICMIDDANAYLQVYVDARVLIDDESLEDLDSWNDVEQNSMCEMRLDGVVVLLDRRVGCRVASRSPEQLPSMKLA